MSAERTVVAAFPCTAPRHGGGRPRVRLRTAQGGRVPGGDHPGPVPVPFVDDDEGWPRVFTPRSRPHAARKSRLCVSPCCPQVFLTASSVSIVTITGMFSMKATHAKVKLISDYVVCGLSPLSPARVPSRHSRLCACAVLHQRRPAHHGLGRRHSGRGHGDQRLLPRHRTCVCVCLCVDVHSQSRARRCTRSWGRGR